MKRSILYRFISFESRVGERGRGLFSERTGLVAEGCICSKRLIQMLQTL